MSKQNKLAAKKDVLNNHTSVKRIEFLDICLMSVVIAGAAFWVFGGYLNADFHNLISFPASEAPGNVNVGERHFGNHTFGDYLLSIDQAKSLNPWTNSVIRPLSNYPALPMIIFKIFSTLPWSVGLTFYLLTSIISIAIPVVLVSWQGLYLDLPKYLVIVLSSVGVIAALDRGNIMGLLCLPMYLFFHYAREEKWKKASIVLAVLISVKIYPIFLTIILIRNKKFKEIVLAGLLSAIFIFAPAVFFEGNFLESCKGIVRNILSWGGPDMLRGISQWNISLFAAITHLNSALGIGRINSALYKHAWLPGIAYLLFVVVSSFLLPKNSTLTEMLVLSSLWLVPPSSAPYVLICSTLILLLTRKREGIQEKMVNFQKSPLVIRGSLYFSILLSTTPIIIPFNGYNIAKSLQAFAWAISLSVLVLFLILQKIKKLS
jgi:Glycosyltransferase family 87